MRNTCVQNADNQVELNCSVSVNVALDVQVKYCGNSDTDTVFLPGIHPVFEHPLLLAVQCFESNGSYPGTCSGAVLI